MALVSYAGWWAVPSGLLTATQLKELEFPREACAKARVGVVEAEDWSGRDGTVDLYDALRCPPTGASARQLEAAAARSTRPRVCTDCGARSQRLFATDVGGCPLCPACRGIILLRRAQQKALAERAAAAERLTAALHRPDAAVVQVDLTVPPPTSTGSRRPPIAARVHAVDAATGRRLVDGLVSLVGRRARIRVEEALPAEYGRTIVHDALLGRPLIVWHPDDLRDLRLAAPHKDWPSGYSGRAMITEVWSDSMIWRAQLDERRRLVPALPPGSPDRLLLHLRRIAAAASSS